MEHFQTAIHLREENYNVNNGKHGAVKYQIALANSYAGYAGLLRSLADFDRAKCKYQKAKK